MPRRQEFKENAYYHVYNRGLHKQTLFHDNKDFQRFLWYIDLYKEKCKDDLGIIAYCLLPNHFHFVLHNKTSSSKLSYFIGNVCASYTRYYKAKYQKEKGRLFFEGRFRAKQIQDEKYLSQCVKYVEYNALKHGLISDIDQRLFTSYDKNRDGTKPTSEILELDWEFDF